MILAVMMAVLKINTQFNCFSEH